MHVIEQLTRDFADRFAEERDEQYHEFIELHGIAPNMLQQAASPEDIERFRAAAGDIKVGPWFGFPTLPSMGYPDHFPGYAPPATKFRWAHVP